MMTDERLDQIYLEVVGPKGNKLSRAYGRAVLAAQPQPEEPYDFNVMSQTDEQIVLEPEAQGVVRQMFALCEWFENLPDGALDSQEVERFKAGQRFAAKSIRTAIGTWFTDEGNARAVLAAKRTK